MPSLRPRPGAIAAAALALLLAAPLRAQEPSAPQPDTTLTAPAQVRNRAEVGDAVARLHPAALRERGWGGRVLVALRVDTAGRPMNVTIHEPTIHAALDTAALAVAREIRFEPALVAGQAVETDVVIPITFPEDPRSEAAAEDTAAGEVIERAPELANRAAVARMIERAYPPAHRDAGISAFVVLKFIVMEDGSTAAIRVLQSSGPAEFDEVAVRVGATMRFRPARVNGRVVRTYASMPITFTPPMRPLPPPPSRP